jgi:hypothetical protein
MQINHQVTINQVATSCIALMGTCKQLHEKLDFIVRVESSYLEITHGNERRSKAYAVREQNMGILKSAQMALDFGDIYQAHEYLKTIDYR